MTLICTSEPYVMPQPVGASDAWTQQGGTQEILDVFEDVPPREVAEALGTEGRSAVCRRRLMRADGTPFEIVESWYPQDIAAGTALAAPRRVRGGAVTLLAEMGYVGAEFTEDVFARVPTPAEFDLLALCPDGSESAVLELRRTSYTSDGTPFAHEVMVRIPDRRQRYRLTVG